MSMHFLTFDGRPHAHLEGTTFLLVAHWHSQLYLLFSDEVVSKSRFKDMKLVSSTKQGYFWVAAAQCDLMATRPKGIIVGLQWENTLFKFFQWACQYRNLNVKPELLTAMVSRATNEQGYSFLPDPLAFFRYDWSDVSAEHDGTEWQQRKAYEGDGELFLEVKPAGWICGFAETAGQLRGLRVLGPSPDRKAIETQLLAPYQAKMSKIQKLATL